MKTKYLQCNLKKGNLSTTSWIPENHAIKNKIVKLKQDNGSWDNGWEVIEIGTVRLDEEYVSERSRDYTKQRDASDI